MRSTCPRVEREWHEPDNGRRWSGTDYSPSFVFRWASTGAPHAQSAIRSRHDKTWYDRHPIHDVRLIRELTPQFDAETERVYKMLKPAAHTA